MKRISVIILFSLFATKSIAAETIYAVTIANLGTGWGGEGTYITTYESKPSSLGCNNTRFFVDIHHLMHKEITTILIAAYYAGTKVHLRVTDCMGPDRISNVAAVTLARPQ